MSIYGVVTQTCHSEELSGNSTTGFTGCGATKIISSGDTCCNKIYSSLVCNGWCAERDSSGNCSCYLISQGPETCLYLNNNKIQPYAIQQYPVSSADFDCISGSPSNECPKSGPQVQCIYDLSQFQSVGDVQNFKNTFSGGDNFAVNYLTLLTYFCGQTTTNCQGNQTTCSVYNSPTPNGPFCQNEFNSLGTEITNNFIQKYCSINNTDDCSCINRTQSPYFSPISNGASADNQLACWFKPCQYMGYNFVPEDMRSPTCPNSVCDQVRQNVDNGSQSEVSYANQNVSYKCQDAPQNSHIIIYVTISVIIFIVILIIIFLVNK